MDVMDDLRGALAAYEATMDGRLAGLRLIIGAILLTRMDGRGWTQRELATAAGVNSFAVARAVEGEACDEDHLMKMMEALGLIRGRANGH